MKNSVSIDTKKLRALIQARLDELQKTVRGASIEAGLGASTIRNILDGKSSAPRVDTLIALTEVLQLPTLWFSQVIVHQHDDDADATMSFDPEKLLANVSKEIVSGNKFSDENMMQLVSPFKKNQFWVFEFFRQTYIERPYQLRDAKNAYAVTVRDDTMYPAYKQDEIIYVDPRLTIKNGEDFIFYFKEKSLLREKIGLFGRLDAESEDGYLVLQFGGANHAGLGPLPLSKDMIETVHAVAGREMRQE